MIAIPLLLLALAAGIYLLITVTREYLGGLFKALAWLVIVLSLLSIVGVGFHGLHHLHRMHRMGGHAWGPCMERHTIMKEYGIGMGHDSVCPMGCCKMRGDSMIMDKDMCAKMMGKEACEKMCAERGCCIMSKDECARMCGGGNSCCTTDKTPPCGAGKAASGDMKDCCKKKM